MVACAPSSGGGFVQVDSYTHRYQLNGRLEFAAHHTLKNVKVEVMILHAYGAWLVVVVVVVRVEGGGCWVVVWCMGRIDSQSGPSLVSEHNEAPVPFPPTQCRGNGHSYARAESCPKRYHPVDTARLRTVVPTWVG